MVCCKSKDHPEYLIHSGNSILGAATIRQTTFLDAKFLDAQLWQIPMSTVILLGNVPLEHDIQMVCTQLMGDRGRGKP